MKKIMILITSACLVLSATACTKKSDPDINSISDGIGQLTEEDYVYRQHTGIWYGFGTDGNDAQFEISINSNDEFSATMEIKGWGANAGLEKEEVPFVFTTADKAYETTDENHQRVIEFKINEYGKETMEIKYFDKTSGNQIAESIQAGRYTDRSTAFGESVANNIQENYDYASEKNKFQDRYNQLNSKSIKDGPQQEMNIASGNLYEEWDLLLNDVYNYLKTIKASSEFENIKNDEIAWISKKDAAVEASRNEFAGGSMAPLAANTTAIEYTKQRCSYLISLIN